MTVLNFDTNLKFTQEQEEIIGSLLNANNESFYNISTFLKSENWHLNMFVRSQSKICTIIKFPNRSEPSYKSGIISHGHRTTGTMQAPQQTTHSRNQVDDFPKA